MACCNDEQAFFLVTFICYLLAVRILWFAGLIKPFKLWTTFMHEFSHALGAWITCNTVSGIEVNSNEGGLTHWSGPAEHNRCSQHVVLPAGYLGSTAWGVAILLSCVRREYQQIMGFVLVAALGICLLYALFGKTNEERMPLIMVSIGFGIWIGILTLLSIFDPGEGWDLGLLASLLWVGTLNALYGTLDIYDDTVKRTDARSDAARCAQLHPSVLSPKCVGGTWFIIALVAFVFSVYWYLELEEKSYDSLSWWVYLPGPAALGVAVLHRTYVIYSQSGGNFSLSFCLMNLCPRAAKSHATPTTPTLSPAPKL